MPRLHTGKKLCIQIFSTAENFTLCGNIKEIMESSIHNTITNLA